MPVRTFKGLLVTATGHKEILFKRWGTKCAKMHSKVQQKLIWSFNHLSKSSGDLWVSLFSMTILLSLYASTDSISLRDTDTKRIFCTIKTVTLENIHLICLTLLYKGISSCPVWTGGIITVTNNTFSLHMGMWALHYNRLEKCEHTL